MSGSFSFRQRLGIMLFRNFASDFSFILYSTVDSNSQRIYEYIFSSRTKVPRMLGEYIVHGISWEECFYINVVVPAEMPGKSQHYRHIYK